MNLADMLSNARAMAEALVHTRPVVHIEDEDGKEAAALVVNVSDGQAKEGEAIAACVRQMMEKFRVKELAIITEAWMACGDESNKDRMRELAKQASSGTIADEPETIEVLIVSHATRESEELWYAKLERPDEDTVLVGPWRQLPHFKETDDREGRLVNLFSQYQKKETSDE